MPHYVYLNVEQTKPKINMANKKQSGRNSRLFFILEVPFNYNDYLEVPLIIVIRPCPYSAPYSSPTTPPR